MCGISEPERLAVNEAAQEIGLKLILASRDLSPEITQKYAFNDWLASLAVSQAFLRVAHLMVAGVHQLDETELAEAMHSVIKDALRRTPWTPPEN